MKTNAQKAAARRKAEAANLVRFGGDRAAASIAHHEARKARAAAANPFDHATYRDAENVLRSLRG